MCEKCTIKLVDLAYVYGAQPIRVVQGPQGPPPQQQYQQQPQSTAPPPPAEKPAEKPSGGGGNGSAPSKEPAAEGYKVSSALLSLH